MQISADAAAMIGWCAHSKEMYFLQPDPQNSDVHVIAVEGTTAFKPGAPRELFKVAGPVRSNPLQWEERIERQPTVRIHR